MRPRRLLSCSTTRAVAGLGAGAPDACRAWSVTRRCIPAGIGSLDMVGPPHQHVCRGASQSPSVSRRCPQVVIRTPHSRPDGLKVLRSPGLAWAVQDGRHSAPALMSRRLTVSVRQPPLSQAVTRTACSRPDGFLAAPLADARLGVQRGVAGRGTCRGLRTPLPQGFPLRSNERIPPWAPRAFAAIHPRFGLLARAESMAAFPIRDGGANGGTPCTT